MHNWDNITPYSVEATSVEYGFFLLFAVPSEKSVPFSSVFAVAPAYTLSLSSHFTAALAPTAQMHSFQSLLILQSAAGPLQKKERNDKHGSNKHRQTHLFVSQVHHRHRQWSKHLSQPHLQQHQSRRDRR